ncbi:MAG: TRAP transporter substrate-binding protein [Treponema sp.]|nr:TRAP transporter substrate-binding protein [Treponema sp.]
MKKILMVFVMSCTLVGVAFAGGRSDSQVINLRYAHVGIPGEIQTRFAYEFAVMVRERTNGAVNIQVFPNSQLGGANEMVDAVRSGAISMGHHDFATLGRFLTDISVFNAPYIYRDGAHALAATNPRTSPALQQINEELVRAAGMRVIGSHYRGARHLSANFPVFSPDDLRGVRIRAVPVALWTSMVSGMGAIPTPVEITELHTALFTGMVAGQENPITNIYVQRFHEVQSHIMMTGHMHSVLSTFINESVWQSLGTENQRIIQDVLGELALMTYQWTNEEEAPVIQAMKDHGVVFIDEASGLRNDLFRQAVNAQIAIDYPGWVPLIQQIENVR